MILISGSPGNIGTPLAQQLVEQGEKIRLIVRDPKKPDPTLAKLQARGAEIVRGDFADPDSLAASFTGVSSAFLLTPVAQQTAEWKRNFIHAAKQKGVQRMVNLSVAGASATRADRPFPMALASGTRTGIVGYRLDSSAADRSFPLYGKSGVTYGAGTRLNVFNLRRGSRRLGR